MLKNAANVGMRWTRRAVLITSFAFTLTYPAQGQFTITADSKRVSPGHFVTLTAKNNADNSSPAGLDWKLEPGVSGFSIVGSGSQVALKVDSGACPNGTSTNPCNPSSGLVSVKATDGSGHAASINIEVSTRPGGLITIPVIGFEQAGASAAQSHQKFFFNFFVSRPLPLRRKEAGFDWSDEAGKFFGPRLRWWGDVRIASYPQQVTSGVAEFATGFAAQVGQLKVNQLAQAGEFNTGLDYRLSAFPKLFPTIGDSSSERVMLSVLAGFGAISPFNPVEVLEIFNNPDPLSAQGPAFYKQFPSSKGFQYTGFTTPDRDRFFWEYGAGVRLTTLYFNNSGQQGVSPAMITYALGQNQLVSGGVSRGIVQKLEAFFPLPLGERFAENVTTVYLFGRADMRLAGAHQVTPFVLGPAASSIAGFNPQVNIVALRSNRDTYTIGVGVDAVKLIKTLSLQNSKPQASSN